MLAMGAQVSPVPASISVRMGPSSRPPRWS